MVKIVNFICFPWILPVFLHNFNINFIILWCFISFAFLPLFFQNYKTYMKECNIFDKF